MWETLTIVVLIILLIVTLEVIQGETTEHIPPFDDYLVQCRDKLNKKWATNTDIIICTHCYSSSTIFLMYNNVVRHKNSNILFYECTKCGKLTPVDIIKGFNYG